MTERTRTKLCRPLGVVAAAVVTGAGCGAAPIPVSGEIDLDGARIGYVIEGEGYPCIAIGSTRYYTRVFPPELKRQLRCAFVDTRVFVPPSDPEAGAEYSLDVAVADIEAARQALGIDSALVFGHSMHALLALEYARRHADRATHVVMVGMAPHWGDFGARAFWEREASPERRAIHAERLAGLGPSVAVLSGGAAFIARYVMNGALYWYDSEFDATPLWEGVHVDMASFDAIRADMANYDIRRGDPVERPVLLALGRHDYAVPYTTWDGYLDAIPRLSYSLYDYSGHTPMLEEPARFASELAAWMESIAGSEN